MNKTWIFDLDDTLMYNLHDYSQPLLDFVKMVVERIGPRAPDIPTIINLEDKIDSNKVKEWIPLGKGFSKERFPISLAETYREICKPLGINDEDGEIMAWQIGKGAFNVERWKKQGLVNGAVDTINYLKSKGDNLILMTKGDPEVQEMKISANNLESFFEKRHIVPNKNKEVIYSVLNGQNLDNVWHVGNSIKSDIIPSIEAGIGAIYVPLETWSFEKNYNAKDFEKKMIEHEKKGKYFKIDKISEIKNIYDKL